VSARSRSDSCRCNDCGYTVEVAEGLPSTCPKCGGALTLVER
jgi:predicted Zn-ribbon and HTH transcriptional regulator